ncbi:MAG: TIGR04372 family glycosyltransferase [Actinomycetota bacterium]
MNRRAIKKKFYQEVIFDVDGIRNSKVRIVLRFSSLCLKAFGGVLLTLVLAPLSLFRPIEIWQMQTRRSKISFFIRDLEFGLQNIKARGQLGKRFVFVLYPIRFPNSQLALMYRRHLTILGKKQRYIAEAFRFVWPIARIEMKGRLVPYGQERFELWNRRTPTLSFMEAEVSLGNELDRGLLLGPEQPYVCLAFSSKNYRINTDYAIDKYNNLGKGNKDNLFKIIPEIASYLPAINEITKKGIAVVRTGILEDERLPTNLGPLVHDYSFGAQSAFGDVWLYSKCLFSFAGGGSGSHWFASIFNIPCVFTDQFIVTGSYLYRDLFIMQLPWLIAEKRFATFEWMSRKENVEWAVDESRIGIEYSLIKNTSSQIIDVIEEMIERLNGTWQESVEDIELQRRFRGVVNLLPPSERNPARMGAKFLREHQHLLPQ